MNTAVSLFPTQQASASEAEIKRVFDKQRGTMLRLRTSTADERIAKIKRLKAAVLAHADSLYEAADKDFKKPPAEVDGTEIMPVVADANEVCRHLKKWMKPKGVWPTMIMGGTSSWIQHEPLGRTLIISPWNYPINLTFGPLVYAIGAGNTAILKPSEMTPNMTGWMVKVIREVFSEDEVAIFEGDASVSTTLLSLPFDHTFFTGSPAVGKVVMTAAAKHLTKVTLELGGKSPTIVDETANLDLAAQVLAWGKFANNGQTCIAPDYVYVHASVKDAFVQKFVDVLKKSYGNTPQEQLNSPNLARIVNERHTKRVAALLTDAKQRGAKVICGDMVSEKDHYVAPTLIENIPAEAKIMEEEIFGPLLPILTYTDLDAVLKHVNDNPKPLALYIWSKNESNIQKILKNTSAGGTCINHCLVHFLHGNLPFGGVNNSGLGSSHGYFGFRAFSHERAVLRTRIMLAKMLFPPYTKLTRTMSRIMMKLT
ncbi:MAG TPA: aldehyde dehydrogenase family protein [Nevskiaceae bacterium]|nr:aldehyde dehydrogenase family protein [Nevskiaceae bacterium]